MIATMVSLAFGAEIGLAADYQDIHGNVCEGNLTPAWCNWETLGTNYDNVAMGPDMMPALTTGDDNTALNYDALESNKTGQNNVAVGISTLAHKYDTATGTWPTMAPRLTPFVLTVTLASSDMFVSNRAYEFLGTRNSGFVSK
jgi:hypothetical protein